MLSFMRGVLQGSASQIVGYKWEVLAEEDQWREYDGYFGSFDSDAIERQYQLNPRGQLHFKSVRKKTFSYTLDFSRMRQVNHNTRTERVVRRTARVVRRTPDSGSQQSSSQGTQPRWQFRDIGGTWKDYSKGRQCSISSQDIERQYQQNPSGTMTFIANNYTYELKFSDMTQRNLSTNTTRSVRRLSR